MSLDFETKSSYIPNHKTGASRIIRGGDTKMTNHPNRATTYTVLNRHGDVQSQGETLATAAQIVLGYDGHEFEIRQDGGRFELWTSTFSRNSTAYNGLARSRISSLNTDAARAAADIYRQVIRNADWFEGQRVETDADYAAEVAEAAVQD
jgi:hypothetical protein